MAKIISRIRPTYLYEEAIRRYQELLKIKVELEVSLEKAPPGKIHVIRSKNRTQFYLRMKKTDLMVMGEYISKSDALRLRTYIQKAYDEKILKHLDRELSILESFLRKSNCFLEGPAQIQTKDQVKGPAQIPTTNFIKGEPSIRLSHPVEGIQQIYSSFPEEARKYIIPITTSDEEYVKHWLDISYVGKEIPEYLPCYETNRKEKVRSKSELNIANALAAKGIPYKYECPLVLKNGITIYPDFTVLNVRERGEIYWEHRGMMDDKDYARNSVSRIETYVANGYFLGTDLIITEETSASPLGTNEIDAIIKKYLQGP